MQWLQAHARLAPDPRAHMSLRAPFHPRLSALSKLKELKLYDNRIVQIGTGLQALSALHTLDLSSNRITDLQVGHQPCTGYE